MTKELNNNHEALLTDFQEAKTLFYAGHFIGTFVGASSRITYKVVKPRRWDDRLYVYYLSGSDNQHDYSYLAKLMVKKDKPVEDWASSDKVWLNFGRDVNEETKSAKGLRFLHKIFSNNMEKSFAKGELWHSNCCARCGRALTDPESIERRLGPVCAHKV
jgi:hypothetical protein